VSARRAGASSSSSSSSSSSAAASVPDELQAFEVFSFQTDLASIIAWSIMPVEILRFFGAMQEYKQGDGQEVNSAYNDNRSKLFLVTFLFA
jgi:hypothetical protein